MKTKIVEWSSRRSHGFQRGSPGQRWYIALTVKSATRPTP